MSWCAGFSDAFYQAYWQVNMKQPGFEKRRDLYLVYAPLLSLVCGSTQPHDQNAEEVACLCRYHYLNHYNLFGYSYLNESERLLKKLQRAVS